MLTLDAATRAYVYAVCHRILRSPDAANDATQDALLRAYRHRDRFRGEASPRTWLHRIAITTSLGYLRQRKRSREDLGTELAPEPIDDAPTPEEAFGTHELAARTEALLAARGDVGARVLAMRGEEHADKDIAAELGLSLANVRVRACRTRTWLREQLPDLAA